jgi:hypothetical protein
MRGDDDKPTRRELARQHRKIAYQRAKAARAADPRYIAMKEAAKQRRREAYKQAKERRKLAAGKVKQESKVQKEEHRTEERATLDAELMKLLRFATKGSGAPN